MKIIYSKCNYNRKEAYQTLVQIFTDQGKSIVRKKVIQPAALAHIKNLSIAYAAFQDLNTKACQAKILEISEEYVDFEFVDAPSLSLLIEEALCNREFSRIAEILTGFKQIIGEIPSIEEATFENHIFTNGNDEEKSKCLPAFFDLNFDNLLKQGEKYRFIDNEWYFPGSVPIKYLYFRALLQVCYQLQQIIQTFCSKEFSCLEVKPDFLVPRDWLEIFELQYQELERYFTYERNFQNHVLLRYHSHNILPKPLKTITNRHSLNLEKILEEKDKRHVEMDQIINQKLSDIEELKAVVDHYQKDIDTLNAEIKRLRSE